MNYRMLKRIGRTGLVMLIMGLMLLPNLAAAKSYTPFTADHVTTTPDGQQLKGKIYSSKDKVRMEMKQPGMPGTMIILYSKGGNKSTMIMSSSKKYFEMSASDIEMTGLLEEANKNKKKLGTETVNGIKCTKYQVTQEINVMGIKKSAKVIIWQSDDYVFPIKTQSEEGATQELRNIKKGDPPAKLFKIPADYKKANNMMELMMPSQ